MVMPRIILSILVVLGCSITAQAQYAEIRPLPPIDSFDIGDVSPALPAAYPPELSESLLEVETLPQVQPPGRQGFFQGVKLVSTWIPAGDLGATSVDFSATFAMPAPTPDEPLIITPRFEMHLLEGPDAPDLPSQAYDVAVQFRSFRKINECWTLDLAVSPGWHSDLESSSSEALRITGHALGIYEWSPTLKLLGGVVYLDREDISLIPAAGLIWTPTEDQKLELIVPRPRYAVRYWQDHGCEERWWYIGGEYGGGSWAIRRAAGFDDVATYSDYRALVGIERKVFGGLSSRYECGFVFGRELEYKSGTPDFEPASTVFVRAGYSY